MVSREECYIGTYAVFRVPVQVRKTDPFFIFLIVVEWLFLRVQYQHIGVGTSIYNVLNSSVRRQIGKAGQQER